MTGGAAGAGAARPVIGARPRVPPALVRDVWFVRAPVAWVAVHGMMALATLIAYPPPLSAAVAALAAWLVLFDVRISRETLLFANLGISRAQVALWTLPSVALLEVAWHLATRLFGLG